MGIPGFKSISVKDFAKQFYQRFLDSDLSGIAAELSYYCLFSLFPLLIFIVALAAYLPIQGAVNETLTRLSSVMPKTAMDIIQDNLNELVNHQRPKLMSIGVLICIWSASRAVNAFMAGLNLVYGVKDQRSYIKVQALAIGVTLASSLLILIVFAVMLLGGKLGYTIADHIHAGHAYVALGSWLRWPLGIVVITSLSAACYYILPDVKEQHLKTLLPGAFIGTMLWLVVTWGFTRYATAFGNYNATYGSIGGVIVLMTWLYLSGLIFLIGGEINAILKLAAEQGLKGAPLSSAPSPAKTPALQVGSAT